MRALLLIFLSMPAAAQTRTFFALPSSNGHSVVMTDTQAAKVVHFRDHLTATEEPVIDAAGKDVFVGNQPQIIKSRDLLFDAYFGLRVNGQQRWLQGLTVDSSGYEDGIVTWTQQSQGLTLTTYVFAPRTLPHSGFVMLLKVTSATAMTGVSVFSLHNFHLGFGRPGVASETGFTGETISVAANKDVLEKAFAGVIVARPLGSVAHALGFSSATAAAQNGYQIVQNGGVTDLPDSAPGDLPTADDSVSAFQFNATGTEAWAGVVVAHSGNPFAGATVQGWLDTYVGTRTPQQLYADEKAGWAQFQQSLTLPSGLSADEQKVARQSAVMLAMAQVKESSTYLREFLTTDGEPRRSRFSATLPGEVTHKGAGAVLACLPPGEWTYAWVRDGAYAASAMAALGMRAQAREALRFLLDAEGGRFQSWNELAPYAFPPYAVSLTRYTGFGVEETDFNGSGPNLEFDGFGLTLWALKQLDDTSLIDEKWAVIGDKIAAPLAALVDPGTKLIRKDSSIWETHWNGRERSWAYTTITAVRGLCDAAAMAERKGDPRAAMWKQTALDLRSELAKKLTDANGALASNLEELQAGRGYHDAAVLDAIALGLFARDGRIATATLSALDQKLRVGAGPGWARNDDRTDHSGASDLSPWGSEYDSAEWVFTDMRGAIASPSRRAALLKWTTDRSGANAGVVPETYDEASGAWKFNAPMIGFGAGAYVLALANQVDPACGAYFDESAMMMPADGGMPVDAGTSPADAGTNPGTPSKGCGCGASSGLFAALLLWLPLARRRRPFAETPPAA